MNNIFISYKVHNRATAIEYYKYLKDRQYQVWFDQLVSKNADWKKTIQREIKNSKIVLCLLSRACLLDDWVLYQLKMARKYNKDVFFIALDDTPWEEHPEYKVKKTYRSLYDFVFRVQLSGHPTKKHLETGLPFLNIGLMAIFTCFALLLGINFRHIALDYKYGCIMAGILFLLVLSYFHKRIVYIIQSILAIGLLAVTIYIIPPYYASGISINAVFFIAFYVFCFVLRYSKINLWLALLSALFYSVFITAFIAAIVVFANYFYDYDCIWISLILLSSFLIYEYWGIKNDFR